VTLIYHITTRDAALSARLTGEYRADSLAEAGFIHFSQRHQILGVANAFYLGQTDLVILVVDPARLKVELKYEPPVHPSASASAPAAENLFPHLYGPLNFEAVSAVVDFPPDVNGRFSLPEALN
jgi:uncharacterized protein (DUF952 family)